jgi:hypothetical protein
VDQVIEAVEHEEELCGEMAVEVRTTGSDSDPHALTISVPIQCHRCRLYDSKRRKQNVFDWLGD